MTEQDHRKDLHPVLRSLLERPHAAVMGILNITPDSFSDGGRYQSPDIALAHARSMIAAGADIIDVGAESTRPYGSQPVTADDEWQRLKPALADVIALGTPVSIDTFKAAVADKALAAGVAIANDIWGLQHDPDMARVVAAHGAPVVVMHNRHDINPALDIVQDMIEFFDRTIEIAARAGIPAGHLALDPGIGFGKTPEQSMTALARLDALKTFGIAILVGASRKKFISTITPSEPTERLGGSIAAHLISMQRGADIIRAHDVAETVQALRVAKAIEDLR